MTGRTHDLAAFTFLTYYAATQPLPKMSLATAAVALGANLMGGLLPDLDDATSSFWEKIPAGTLIGKIIHPLIGHHRMITHSILGMAIAGYLLKVFLTYVSTFLLVNMNIVWWAVMIGYLSHLIADSLTTEGVPWFFPIPVRLGFPPFKLLRMKTGGLMEKIIVFPGLVLLNGYIIYSRYPFFLLFFKSLVK